MSPTRRSVLHLSGLALTGLVAGCVADGGQPGGNGTETPDDELPGSNDTGDDTAGGTRLRGTGGPGIALVSTDEPPALPLEPAVKITKDAATEEAPPQLCLSLTNTSDKPLNVGEGRAIFFQYVLDDDEQLMLLPADEEYPVKAGCWRLTEPIAITEEFRVRTLQPGEEVTERIDVYGAPGGDGCLPVGTFHFNTTYSVLPDDSAENADSKMDNWGFTISLE